MAKSNLKQAHNNLLHLINSIEDSEGLFLVYAATPDFYASPTYGIQLYGALAQRIGRPESRAPRALDRVWNLDELETTVADYQQAASKIRQIYCIADPGAADSPAFIGDEQLKSYVAELRRAVPRYSRLSPWRVITQGTIEVLESSARGEDLKAPEELHDEIVEQASADEDR
jgi:hypothetical protein